MVSWNYFDFTMYTVHIKIEIYLCKSDNIGDFLVTVLFLSDIFYHSHQTEIQVIMRILIVVSFYHLARNQFFPDKETFHQFKCHGIIT